MITALAVRIQTMVPDRDDRGATAVEYGLIVALIIAVAGAAIGLLGDRINTAFNNAVSLFP